MPTDTERRAVARRLRRAWANVPDRNPARHHMRVLYEIYTAVGLNDDGVDAIDLFDRLADLIDPDTTTDTTKSPELTTKCDRDELLALADELSGDTLTVPAVFGTYMGGYVAACQDVARRIREALGVES